MIPVEAIELVKRFEGLHKLRSDGLVWPYFCPAGVPTIGWGTVVSSINHPPITPEEALERLMVELEACYRAALRMSPILSAHPARLSAIISFIYNLGSGRYRASTLKRRVDEGKWLEAGREIRRWIYGGGRKLPGLILRREAEAWLLEK
jgi:lysozyme